MVEEKVPVNFLDLPKIQDFKSLISANQSLLLEEVWDSPLALLLAACIEEKKANIVVITGGAREGRLFEDLPFFGHYPLEFPAWETLPSEEILPSPDIVGERYRILEEIQKSNEPRILFCTLQSCLQKILAPEKLNALYLVLKTGEAASFEDLPLFLSEMGYHKKAIAADKGEFALRGAIIDIFPVSLPDPYRIEIFDDRIESIRRYDPVSQVSVGKVNEFLITPAREIELLNREKTLASLFDYLGPRTIIVFDDLFAIEDKSVALQEMLSSASKHFFSTLQFFERIESFQKLFFTSAPLEELSEVKFHGKRMGYGSTPEEISFEAFNNHFSVKRWRHPFIPLQTAFSPPDLLPQDLTTEIFLKTLSETSLPVHVLCTSEADENSFKEKLSFVNPSPQAQFFYEKGYLSSGFLFKDPLIALLPTTELTHRFKIRRQKQRTHYHTLPVELLSVTAGEAVVHMNSGIGRFLGIEKRPNHLGVETEYMLIEYAQGAKLYVPMEQANLISKYIGTSEEPPKLHALGDAHWKRTRERTEQAIAGYAKDLLELQAERSLKEGFLYPSDGQLVLQFDEEFPYEETPDQLQAITAIRSDMQSKKLMDRLVCGDVGYGKTEVAMRAAFKAVADGSHQVAVLVPTTVLAMQHHETFSERMANFPIRIGLLSRFRTPKQIKETLKQIEAGEIDIVIGTHRVVSKDVQFKNLGLLIIDEEQRFGVKAKEHLKTLKKDIDCITLSATPIPRTLYMSLVGARDMSVINTPPEDRLPIQTFICQISDEVLKNALLRELTRDGQAYVIHNRVETIFQMADRLQKLLPAARIVVGHGQMFADELDLVFHSFKTGKADILIATSIIENGIDIPNANTILVDRADRFGLADLYQIRGRVGRWNRKAYCYFLVPNTRELSEISRKRLSALAQSSGHGGGMKVAMHDLEIRGAGNILGTEQSGHVAAIGYHLYVKLLRKTIASLQKTGSIASTFTDVKIEFPYDARIPEDYVDEIALRLEMYQRLGDSETEAEIDQLMAEMADRFGPLPIAVQWLQSFSKIRLFASRHRFSLLKITKVILLAEQSHGKKEKISRKILFQLPKTPEELEKKVIGSLKENFPLKRES